MIIHDEGKPVRSGVADYLFVEKKKVRRLILQDDVQGVEDTVMMMSLLLAALFLKRRSFAMSQ